ncbi:hypothetical protein KFE25_001072 [Diacronema lutheri]|uniref:Uncharacterized protein n=1 Tax=Diacronema lutheri TaxID=2081491 RepID=A0A8J6CBG8_DIALT|nr:hypothetical protein KFE25_001072 [Diacronema lutheri]
MASARAVLVPPDKLLAHIRPHRRILAACVRGGSIGFALSDPYFSHATPLLLRRPLAANWWASLVREHSVGAVAFALPASLAGADAEAALAERAELLRGLVQPEGNGTAPPGSVYTLLPEKRLSDARALAREQPELWEDVAPFLHSAQAAETGALSSAACAAHAAIGLNHFFWVECEGWARNTFG